MKEMEEMRDIVLAIVRQLVTNPEAVQADLSTTGKAAVLLITVGQEDVGRVIGKRGRTIEAIRAVVSSMAAKRRRQIVCDVRAWSPGEQGKCDDAVKLPSTDEQKIPYAGSSREGVLQ